MLQILTQKKYFRCRLSFRIMKPFMQQVFENWKKGNSFFIVEMDEEETIKHQTFIAERSTNFPLTCKATHLFRQQNCS